MTIQSVAIKVGGVPLVVNFDTGLQAYTATLPLQPVDFYTVEIDATDMASTTTTLITFLSTIQGEIVKFFVTSLGGLPVSGVTVVAAYRNATGGTDHGRCETQETGVDGIAYLHLNAGSYNFTISKPGFATKVVNNLQVISGINVFDNVSGTIPHTHVVRNQAGAVVENASVKIEDLTLDPEVRLVAHRKTDVNGLWSAMFTPGRPLAITFEKEALDFQKVGVQSA